MLRNMQSMHWMYRMPVLFEIKSVSQHWPIGRPPKHAGLIGPAMWPPAPAILSAVQPTAHCTCCTCCTVCRKCNAEKLGSRAEKGCLLCPGMAAIRKWKLKGERLFELWPSLWNTKHYLLQVKDYKYLSFRWTNRFLTRVEQDLTVHIWNIRLDVVLELRD